MCVSLLSRKVCKKLDNLFFKNLVEIAWHFLCRNFPLHIYFGRCLYRVVEVVVKPQTFHVDTLLVNALPFGCTCSGLCALLLSTYVRPRPCGRACVRACMCVLRAHAPALLCRGRVWWAELFEREPQASLCTSLPGPYFSPLGPRRPRVSM